MPKQEYGSQGPTYEWIKTLAEIPRFHTHEMIHTTNLYVHAIRVQAMSSVLANSLEFIGYRLDRSMIERHSLHHDDPEVETTDIPSPEKRAMTPQQREELRLREMDAATRLAERFSTLPRDEYIKDQEEIGRKVSVEDQIVDIADKIDGLCETLIELRCGNNDFWDILENYRNIFSDLSRYPIYEKFGIKVPTRRTVKRMPKIDVNLLNQRRIDEFWENVFAPKLPPFFKAWLEITSGGFWRTLTKELQLFPGWETELREARERGGLPITENSRELEDLIFGNTNF